jgi:hypothetical protein
MTITCFCDHEVSVDFPDSINLDKDQKIKEDILNGDFQTVRCPQCGTMLKPEIPVTFSIPSRDITLLYLPEPQRDPFLRGQVECAASRLVIGFPELMEFIKLLRDDLDPRAVETIKFFLLQKCDNQEVRILYDHGTPEKLTFHITGIRSDEIAVSSLPREIYEKTLATLDERAKTEEFGFLFQPPYISINKIFTEKED